MKKIYRMRQLATAAMALLVVSSGSQVIVQTYTYTGAITQFTVPALCGGQMTIEAVGAAGGSVSATCPTVGGFGASMKGVFTFSQGTVLRILAGQMGSTSGSDGGGGGGSFVATLQGTTPVIVAGGGGGASNNLNNCGANIQGMDASITTSGTATRGGMAAGGVNGNGGQLGGNTATSGGAGGGFYTDGAVGANPNGGGKAFVNGGAGGTPNTVSTAGGFGGGGCSWSVGGGGGGGGGYSGGGTYQQSGGYAGGGGGGSFNAGANQVNTASVNAGHGYVVLTYEVGVPITVAVTSNAICEGESLSMTASGNGLNTFTWSTGAQSSNITVTPSVTTAYTVAATNASNCVSTQITTIVVHPLPSISGATSPTLLCVGSQATMTANGAATYTWDNGPQSNIHTVSPDVTTVYSVTGTSAEGCVSGATVEVLVNSNVLGISPSGTICIGEDVTLQASGAQTYSWSNQSLFQSTTVSPTVTTTYFATGVDQYGCSLTNSVTVTVNPRPGVTLSSTKTKVCKGDRITLNAAGADSYTFSAGVGGSGSTGTVIATIDIPVTYTVTGTNSSGCTNTAITTVIVEKCTGLAESQEVTVRIFPNPATDQITVELSVAPAESSIEVYSQTGQLLKSVNAERVNTIDLRSMAEGIYFVSLRTRQGNTVLAKFVKD